MSQGPPIRPARKSSDEPRLRFNWPPTEDELAQYAAESLRPDAELKGAPLEPDEPRVLEASPATDTIGLFPSETRAEWHRAPSPAAPVSWTQVDEAQAPLNGEDVEHSWSEATPTSGITASPRTRAVDAPVGDDFAAEVAHLQALIEGLTQKIEWTVPHASGR